MADAKVFHTEDGAEIEIENGQVTLSSGISEAAYFSMFGGNDDDSGAPDDPKQWWGNVEEPDRSRHYRGRTQAALQGVPVASSNLVRIKEAVVSDMEWMVAAEILSQLSVRVSVPRRNWVRILISGIAADGSRWQDVFEERWGDGNE